MSANTAVDEAVALSNHPGAWRKMGDRVAAEADLERALEKDPSSVPALFTFGRLLETAGRSPKGDDADPFRSGS